MKVNYCYKNPIISPKDIKPLFEDFKVIGTFNAAIEKYNDKYFMLLRHRCKVNQGWFDNMGAVYTKRRRINVRRRIDSVNTVPSDGSHMRKCICTFHA